jgi:mono/diheme cytochrome c family protein
MNVMFGLFNLQPIRIRATFKLSAAFRFCAAFVACCASLHAEPPVALPKTTRTFIDQHCVSCHEGSEAEAGLDLKSLSFDLADTKAAARWVRIHDRVHDGEMPPKDADKVDKQLAEEFLKATGDWIQQHQKKVHQEIGRVRGRRLTRREIERSLHDLLGIDIPLADQLPEEAKSAGFTTVASGQSMSHFQLASYLAVLDTALDEAWRRAFSDDDVYQREFSPEQIVRQNPKRRTREPELREDLAVTWSSGLIFYGRIPATAAPEDGWYRFNVRVSGLKLPDTGGVWSTVRTGPCVSTAPLLPWVTSFEATAEPKDVLFDAWLPKDHMLEIRPGDATLKKGRFAGGQVGTGEGESQDVPGIAFHKITMERIHKGPDNDELRKLLFGDLRVSPGSRKQPGTIESPSPEADVKRLLSAFARRAFRRPVSEDELQGYIGMATAALADGHDVATSLRIGFRAILCSARFLYLTETPGSLDDHAVAARLSYFLTGGPPNSELSRLADAGDIRRKEILLQQADRLLEGAGSRRFVDDFAAQWLDLDQIDFTEPDNKLYPGFDAIVENSMLDETQTYLDTMLRDNLSVRYLIDSDFTFLNSRLARYYGIPDVTGDELRRCELKPEHHRGGVLTQGSILKVTANGSNTSPVVRGVWISERLLGTPIAPPPDNVPAIEPDIRGATTIREQLAKHRQQASCASCHVKIDPPGFAMENFDPSGRWRDRYLAISDGKRGKGPVVDASYQMPDGQDFKDIDGFKSLVTQNPHKLAANVAEKMIVFGTGAAISFADRQALEEIVEQAADQDYGLRSILHAVIAHEIFLSK